MFPPKGVPSEFKNRVKSICPAVLLEAEKQNALREVNKLRNTFAKHDLDNLALNKPKLVEKMVNRGTKRVIDNLVELTTVSEEEPSG